MEILTAIGKFLLVGLAIVGVIVPLIAERRNYDFVRRVWSGFSLKLFFQSLAVLLTVAIISVALIYLVPFLGYGLLSVFYEGAGNAFIAPILEGSRSSHLLVRILPMFFFLAFLFVIPFLSQSEERAFRKGHEDWLSITKQSVKFGLVHLIVGIPLAVGLALTISGLFFGYVYKTTYDRRTSQLGHVQAQDEAVMASTIAHSMYNTIVVSILLVGVTIRIWYH